MRGKPNLKFHVLAVLLVSLTMSLLFTGCSIPGGESTTIGNGKVDPAEEASIRGAVGLALAAKPEAIAPAYAVSSVVLELLPTGGSQTVEASVIDTAIAKEVEKLDLDPLTRQSFNDLVTLAKAGIMEQLGANKDASARLLVVRDVVSIIQQCTADRLVVLK